MRSWTTHDLAAAVSAAAASTDGVSAVYLFGSTLTSETPNDVDLVVVYDDPLTPLSAPTLLKQLQRAVESVGAPPAHVTFLTVAEAGHPGIVADTAQQIYASST
jgi:predicted nucleotidyltransferase